MSNPPKPRNRRIGVKDVRASFNYEVGRQMPLSAVYFGRPVADVLAPLFYNTGWSADGVTYLRVALTFVALACLVSGLQLFLFAAAVLGLLAFILDFVDGHIARLDNKATYWGKYFDGLADYLFPACGPLAAGVGLWLQDGSWSWLLIGAAISLVTLMTRTARDRLRYFEQWMTRISGELTEEERRAVRPWQVRERRVTVAAANGRTLAFLLLFIPDGGLSFFIGLAVIQGVTEPLWLCIVLGRGHAVLRRWRKSVHAAS